MMTPVLAVRSALKTAAKRVAVRMDNVKTVSVASRISACEAVETIPTALRVNAVSKMNAGKRALKMRAAALAGSVKQEFVRTVAG
jgi:hypothetical protein